MKEWNECRLCGSKALDPVVDLGQQVPGCQYAEQTYNPHGDGGPHTQFKYPLNVVRCAKCGLGQLTVSVNPDVMYTSAYGYRSGQTQTMRLHLERLAAKVRAEADIETGDIVLDIGCNDGTLLKAYHTSDDGEGIPLANRVGFDPADLYRGDDIEVAVPERFSAAKYNHVCQGRKAQAVTAIAMFYDLDDPVAFLSEIKSILAKDGILVLEFMDASAMLKGAWDQINHEHVCYYGLAQAQRAIESAGLEVYGVERVDINGGSLRVWAKHSGAGWPITVEEALEIGGVLADELAIEHLWDELPQRVEECVTAIRSFVTSAPAGHSIEILGASQKGNTVLQAVDGALKTRIRCAVERDERKDGLYTPGTGIPIIHESKRQWADRYIVTPWQFKEEILKREREQGAPANTQYLFPLPEPEIVIL